MSVPNVLSVESYSRLLWFCITTLCGWLTKLAPLSQPMTSKIKTNRVLAARVFPRLHGASYMYLLRIPIGSLCCLHLLRLARVITLVLVLRHSIGNCSSKWPILATLLYVEEPTLLYNILYLHGVLYLRGILYLLPWRTFTSLAYFTCLAFLCLLSLSALFLSGAALLAWCTLITYLVFFTDLLLHFTSLSCFVCLALVHFSCVLCFTCSAYTMLAYLLGLLYFLGLPPFA